MEFPRKKARNAYAKKIKSVQLRVEGDLPGMSLRPRSLVHATKRESRGRSVDIFAFFVLWLCRSIALSA